MPLLDRDTIVDRPVLLDRSNNDEQEEEQGQEREVEVLGQGGGPTINGVEFEVGHYQLVAASNLASVLATGEEDGQSFKNVFRNAAIQLYELKERGRDISTLSNFAAQNQVDLLGIQPRQAEMLQGEADTAENGEVNIEEIEEQITQEEPEEDDESEDEEEVVEEEPTGSIQVGSRKTEETEEEEDDEE